MVRRKVDGDEDDAGADAHTSTYSSAGKKSASTDSEMDCDEVAVDTALVLWYLTKVSHVSYGRHVRMRDDEDDEDDESDA